MSAYEELVLKTENERLQAENERLKALLKRVRSYALGYGSLRLLLLLNEEPSEGEKG